MAKKRDDKIQFNEEIIVKNMEDVLHDSMIPYSEHVILERALPRVEDGLKPVQRRILFTMHELGNTADKPHRKCARIVGDCLGKYHPHGDSSVYDALARMAQSFVMRAPLVDGHGNFGSIDGDSPAAMRYTEARMTELAAQLLRDIDKDTVGFHLNFDDTQKEPDLLPARFPNLLVNGASGIAVGLATNIPPHNLGEAIDAAAALIDRPSIDTRGLMQFLKGPDFPTGGILAADGELLQAYETGRGKLQVRARLHLEDGSAGRKLIVITEIPYQVNKAAMLEKILKVSEEKKALFSGIYDIRDESDRTGMRAVIEVRKDADPEKLLNALYKYTDLQVTFGVNMVAIAGGKPVQLGVKAILSHFIAHQKNVVSRRTKYELNQAETRAHVLEGLIVAVDNLDEVIRLIRSSKNPKEARGRLMERFELTEIQAQAILDMRLQRLTNLEILTLRKEYAELLKLIANLKAILASEKKLMNVIKKELMEIREKFADSRRTELVDSFQEIVIEPEAPVADETAVVLTRAGFVKRMPPKALEKADKTDAPAQVLSCFTDEKLLFITDLGNCYPVPVSQIPECRPRDRGIALGGLLAGLEKGENLVSLTPAGNYEGELLFATQNGLVKRTACAELNVRKSRFACISLKGDDRLAAVLSPAGYEGVLLLSRQGMAIHFALEEVSLIGRTAAGVKGMNLSAGDKVAFCFCHNGEGEVLMVSELGYLKRCLLIDFDRQSRGGKGVKAFNFLKNGSNGTYIAGALTVTDPYDFDICQTSGAAARFNTDMVEIESRAGRGSAYVMVVMDDFVCGLRKA
ncbi:MAG: DNA topoisomerase (ATP-hydrolyzing) subunit A [Clostridiales bacterium]|nr:DNA topoisomerase (ATP-hydrolyzing) subunit A [Clostridiales bacterium]